MNPFIRAMEESGEWSKALLKKLYRRASKEVHPDAGKREGGETFVKLRREYEEALAAIASGAIASGAIERRARPSPIEARRVLLASLQRFTVKIFTAESDAILDSMVEAAEDYRPELAALLSRYRAEIYGTRAEWANDANRYYAHSVFIAGARQLFLYYDTGKSLHRTLVARYRETMDGWARNVPPQFTEILRGLYDWIESEVGGERVRR